MPKMLAAVLVFALAASAAAGPPRGRPDDEPALPPNLGQILRSHDLEEFERTHHPLLVFAASRVDERYVEQMGRFAKAEKDLAKRGVVVVSLFRFQGGLAGRQRLTHADSAALRRRYDIGDEDFVVVLVGKDGKEKSRRKDLFAIEALLEEVDGLPEAKEGPRPGAGSPPK